jgi:hypothetical protein
MMTHERLTVAAVVAALTFGCDTDGPIIEPPLPSWTGEYTVRADTVRYCTENQTPTGRTCDCSAPGHLEGTLSLSAHKNDEPIGEIKLRECPPGAACGAEVTYPIVAFNGVPNPNPPPGPRLSFCAGKCPFAGGDGGIHFIDAAIPANPLSGHFWRADGNVRGCGSDSGPFTATKR